MMTVNSKLNVHEKELRKRWLADIAALGGLVMSFPEHRATVAFMPEFEGSRMMLVSVSFAEYRETKFKRKVGEYHALRRMFEAYEFIKIPSVFNVEDMGMYNDAELLEYQTDWALGFAGSLTL